MKSLLKTTLVGTLLALSGMAQAELSANLGYASEYHTAAFCRRTHRPAAA
jgi:hypothetical protein